MEKEILSAEVKEIKAINETIEKMRVVRHDYWYPMLRALISQVVEIRYEHMKEMLK
jgi:hypothetical protein